MSSPIDPAKLKVVELRAELSKRGLETKGNKPALVQRLKKALEEELAEELPDTSIADTSTEDLDSSQPLEQPPPVEESQEENQLSEKEAEKPEPSQCTLPPKSDIQNIAPTEEKMETDPTPHQQKVVQPEERPPENQEQILENDNEKSAENDSGANAENNHEIQAENGEQDEPKSRKSRWGADSENVDSEPKEATENPEDAGKPESGEAKLEDNAEQKGEKRKHSPSPERSQRRRSKSPIKEDEPLIDNSKVQLSWYDSDLHLQLDKESFLSAKPYHEGAFGFAWAGVRATHGVSSGKVCFEVKITEELKWEDFSKHEKPHRRDQHKKIQEKKDSDATQEKKDSDATQEKKDSDATQEKTGDENNPDDSEKQTENQEPMETEKTEEQKTEDNGKETVETEQEKQDKPEEEKMETDETKTEEDGKKQEQEPEIEQEKLEPLPTHLIRVGWSVLESGLQLGEDKFSYGYESSGKFVSEKEFQDYSVKFGVGDVIGSYLNIDEDGFTITYTVNGEVQPTAVTVPRTDLPENFALFPHVSSRNFAFEFNLGGREEAWFEKPTDFLDYEFLEKIENKIEGPVRPETRNECEVILMFGLPGSGKTYWVRQHMKENPDKKYTLIGSTHLLEKMTIEGNTLKSKYRGNWTVLLDKLQKSLNKLIELAALRRRNFIIDQTNVFPSAQRRKLRPFEGFKRRAVVVVVGDEEQAKRQSLQEAQDGKDVPDSAVFEMKANMTLPQKGEWIDEVIYAGVSEEEAKTLIQKYNTQGREAGYGIQRRYGHRDDRHRWQNRRNDYRGNNYRDRNYHNNRYDRGPPRQGNWHPQKPGGWNRDRRDNRGPPVGGSRDWRNRGGNNGRDRPQNRDMQTSSYNRNRNPPNRSGGNWQSGNWGQGNWNNQSWPQQGTWGQGGWGGQQTNQNQWKYGGGSGSQGYGSYGNWNYYGQYAQSWNAQGQAQPASANAYGQYSQQEWAQYAQQYAQQGQNTSSTTTSQTTSQK